MTTGRTCPLCDVGRLGRMFPRAHPWLVRCDRCGLGLADPQPDDAELAAIYDQDYYFQFGYEQDAGAARAALARIKQATYARFLRQAERLVPNRPAGRPRRLLDVGCGLGYSLAAGRRRGWEVSGLEPHAMAGQGVDASLSARIVRGTLDDCQPAEPFDLVSLVDVIEHVREPVEAIRRAGLLLRPGGVLLLATNDLSSGPARRLGPRWVHFHRAHLWYFSPATLTLAVERAGLVCRHVGRAWRVYNLQYVASILAGGSGFALARIVARLALRCVPRPLRMVSWPPVPEGIVLLAGGRQGRQVARLGGRAAGH